MFKMNTPLYKDYILMWIIYFHYKLIMRLINSWAAFLWHWGFFYLANSPVLVFVLMLCCYEHCNNCSSYIFKVKDFTFFLTIEGYSHYDNNVIKKSSWRKWLNAIFGLWNSLSISPDLLHVLLCCRWYQGVYVLW